MPSKNLPVKKETAGLFDTTKTVKTLEGLMEKVTGSNCTAETVNAACNCADKITQILRLHVDVARLKMKYKG